VRSAHDGGVVGRQRELAETNNFVAEAATRACVLLLVGEAGIGKTTILAEVIDEAVSRDQTVLVARPSQAEAELPFAVLSDLFEQVDENPLGALPAVQRGALDQALRRVESLSVVDPTAVALAALAVLRSLSSAAPVLVAVDDLQWVDAASLRTLTFAFRRLDGAPVGLLATTRPEFEDELMRMAVRDPGLVGRVEIRGLGKRHLAQLVFERTGWRLSPPQLAELARLSGGNPLYAVMLAATGDPDFRVPGTLGVALRSQLSALSADARAAGLVAATLGRVDEAVIGRLHDGGLTELRRAAILDVHDGVTWFAHPLLASTILEMHTAGERRDAHLALAATLDSDERAIHLARGTETPDETVAAELEQAAKRLDARGAPETAAMLVERAAELTLDHDVAASTRRLLRASDLYSAAGESHAHVVPLLEGLAQTLPPGRDRARVFVRLGWVGAQVDSMTNSEAVAYQERALAESEGAPDVVVAAHAVLARQLGIGGDYHAALRHAELAVAAGESFEADAMFPSPSGELGMARFLAGKGFDEQLFVRGIELESSLGRVDEPYQSVRRQYALALLSTGQLSRARAIFLDLLALSGELERVRSTAGCTLHLIELELRAGHLAQAEAYAAEFVHLDRQLRGHLSAEWYPSGIVAVHLGQVDSARSVMEAGIEYSRQIGSTKWLAHHLWGLGHLELSVGNLPAARDALVQLPSLLRETGMGEWAVHPVHPDAIETLVGLGEIDRAAELTAELAEYGRRLDRPWGLATAARSEALIAAARGAHDEALAAAERALAEHERLDWPFEHARTFLASGTILRRLGRRRDAAAAFDRSRAIFASLRNPLWLAKAEAEARRLGGRRGARGVLTPTEERVATLAGQGLRNAEIAAMLYVTPKTVEATLSRVYRKLGVRSRTELARRLPEHAGETGG